MIVVDNRRAVRAAARLEFDKGQTLERLPLGSWSRTSLRLGFPLSMMLQL